MRLEIVPYSEKFAEVHSAFASKMWPSKKRRREEKYLRWKFRGPAKGEISGLLLAVFNNVVVGQIGLIPVMVQIANQSFPAQWICDYMVDQSLGSGTGFFLLKAAMARSVISLGSNPSPSAFGTLIRAGFSIIQGPTAMVLPLNLKQVLSWKIKTSWLVSFLSQIGRPILSLRSISIAKYYGNIKVERSSWRDIVPLIQKRQAMITKPYTIHDAEFLEWNCSGFEGLSPERKAVRTASGSYGLYQATPTYFYVYEWYACNKSEMIALFHELYAIARSAGSQTIKVFCQDENEEKWLRGVGFLKMRRKVQILFYPPDQFMKETGFVYSINDSDGNI